MPGREEIFMSRAIEIARRGSGNVSPNPLVGALIVHNDRIISEGWHEKYGESHAEVNAIKDVPEAILQKSEIYVSLEPCSHFGKTPPCANLIIEKKIPKVIIATADPHPKVGGEGIRKLTSAGIEVITGILEKESRYMNRRFLTRIEKGRPYIILKWAESADGFIALNGGRPVAISNEISQRYSHKLRAEEDAIMVGTNTIINDNPSLTTRYWIGSNPLRVTMDFKNRIPKDYRIFDERAESLVFGQTLKIPIEKHETAQSNEDILMYAMHYLANIPLNSVVIEGGKTLLQQFIDHGLWDEAHVFKSPGLLISGIKSPEFGEIRPKRRQILKSDLYYFFQNN